jgi:hypothetical protein
LQKRLGTVIGLEAEAGADSGGEYDGFGGHAGFISRINLP